MRIRPGLVSLAVWALLLMLVAPYGAQGQTTVEHTGTFPIAPASDRTPLDMSWQDWLLETSSETLTPFCATAIGRHGACSASCDCGGGSSIFCRGTECESGTGWIECNGSKQLCPGFSCPEASE